METKKISFGFKKTQKQDKPEVVDKKEYIDCLEEKSIKVIGGEAVKDEKPLVIPMKPNTLVTAERLKEIAEKVESALQEPEPVKEDKTIEEVPENETLEQMAARELLQEAKKHKVVEQPKLLVPLPAKPVMDGEKESTLDDYESVPIQQFGLAMLRGMGWTPGQEQSKYKQPQLRPKGLGLGADKVVKENQKKKSSKDKEEELSIVKGSYVKVTSGKYSGYYGKVLSLDEDNGRVMIELAVKKETVSLSEFMMEAVTKSEFDKQSKVLNSDSFMEYKKNENDRQKNTKQNNSNKDGVSTQKLNEVNNRDNTRDRQRSKDDKYREARDDRYSNGRSKDNEGRIKGQRRRNNSISEEEEDSKKDKKKDKRTKEQRSSNNSMSEEEQDSNRDKKNDKKKYSSSESLNSDLERKVRRRKKRYSSSSSNSSEEEYRRRHKSKSSKSSKEKRDIDKKRKGKKKKRDRDRSPTYRKHKKLSF